jgi:hypothetical protein
MAPVSVVNDQVEGTISPTRIKGILLSFDQEKQKANGKKEHD